MGAPAGKAMVLLSAYNGAPWIAEQIESIRAQSFPDWTLVVRDDQSSDGTVQVVERFCAIDSRISLMRDGVPNVGPWVSFALLLAHAGASGAEYILLSDQDDVWVENKIEQQLSILLGHDSRTPLLVHSDLTLVDEQLRPTHESFSESQGVSYAPDDPLATLLIHNAVVGCTIAMNRALLELALPVPDGMMHDWWLASCAAAAGSIRRTANPTVLYRQHSSNYVGVEPPRAFLRDLLRHPLSFTTGAFRSFGVSVQQARQLRDRMRERVVSNGDALTRVERYCDAFSGKGVAGRLRALNCSRAHPRRMTSRIILRALAAVYPWAERMTSGSGP